MSEQLAGARDRTASRPVSPIDIGGRCLAFSAKGEGGPTVVLETGLGAESAEWAAVQDRLAETVRVCRYDRANRGYRWQLLRLNWRWWSARLRGRA